jgi:hypothetical protein
MKLENLEQRNQTNAMLNRYHANYNSHPPHIGLSAEDHMDDEDDNVELSMLEEEALYEVLSKLERLGGDDKDSVSAQVLANLLPPSLKFLFEKDLKDGTLQELLLERWHPWWRKELVSTADVAEDDTGTIEHAASKTSRFNDTLDDRLLRVPGFDRLGKACSLLSSNTLLFNLLEILYATCWTLRLYHGVSNASNNEPVEAATTLVTASTVLGRDARFSDLSQVLAHCTALSTNSFGRQQSHVSVIDCNSHWTVLVEDVALLVATHRTVGRTLLEASDMIKGACKQLKTKAGKRDKLNRTNKDDTAMLSGLRRIGKKLEFFLSWTQYTPTINLFGDHLKSEILVWKDEWTTLGAEQDDDDRLIHETVTRSLELQSPSAITSSSSTEVHAGHAQRLIELQISEVQTRQLK